jgi:flavin reductase (DIM6/NTAB) family NADH-FMN oxidoreductase RutF
MKTNFDPQNPPGIVSQAWQNEFHIFHWLYHLVNLPNLMFYITTYKENRQNNVCLHAWGYLDSDPNDETYFILSLTSKGHTYQNIRREGVFCINYQTQAHPGLGETVRHNAYEDDEIGASGLSAGACVKINAPRIDECGLHLECEVLWEKAIPGSRQVVFASRVVSVTLDEALLNTDYRQKLGAFDTHLCYTRQINPLSGQIAAVGGEGRLDPGLFEDW